VCIMQWVTDAATGQPMAAANSNIVMRSGCMTGSIVAANRGSGKCVRAKPSNHPRVDAPSRVMCSGDVLSCVGW
jgi:hypothetical protein